MEQLAPLGPVYQAGTLSGNPVSLAAGLATLELVSADGFHQRLDATARRLTGGLQLRAEQAGIPFTTNQAGGMFGCFFSEAARISRFEQVTQCDMERFQRFYHGMLEAGVYLAPSAYEAGFVSAAHTDTVIDTTLDCADGVFKTLQ
jgi:glutamate-1-semialdehyde 2,1-aminomutase